jgi:hypothetical protein
VDELDVSQRKHPMDLTDIANHASYEMLRASFVAENIFWDLDRLDRSFEGSSNPNDSYNESAIQFAASAALAKIVDAYQWYNGQILRLLVHHDRTAFESIREGVTLNSSDLRRIAAGEDALPIAIERFRLRDRSVREHLHKVLGLWEESEMSAMVEIRNCFAHHLGMDHSGQVGQWLASAGSGFGLSSNVNIDNGLIRLGRGTPSVCNSVGLAQISIFDQMAAKKFSLPTSPPRKIDLKRQWKG